MKDVNLETILFGSMIEYHLDSVKDRSRLHQFGKKVLHGLFLGFARAAKSEKGDILVADIEELEILDTSEILLAGHPLTTHTCAVQSVHKRGTHTTRLAQGAARLKSYGLQCHLCAPEKNLSSGVAHVSSLLVDSPASYHEHITFLIHSSF